jgi:ATP-binding cassette, subfamily B (MDR/TAP), member 1
MRPSIEDDTTSIAEELPLDSEKTHGVTIEFGNVSFKFPTRDVAVLELLNMSVSLAGFAKKT